MIKKFLAIGSATVLVTIVNILYFVESDDYSAYSRSYYEGSNRTISVPEGPSKYLINTTNCQIPDTDPFSEDILKFVKKEEYTKCTDLDLLTYIHKDSGVVTLNINTTLLPMYSFYSVTCCYSEIYRVEGDDDKIWFTPCVPFKGSVAIYHPFIKVVCKNKFFLTVYENVHATTLPDNVQYVNHLKHKSLFSVLMVGIDSISKQNLRRTMPKSYKYLERNFINLKGYNKVGDNTYPNLMAILTGQNMKQVQKNCPLSVSNSDKRKDKSFLSRCGFIWNHFSNSGYVTALTEDACPLGTFNYARKGFYYPPTDYYYRPYFLAAEQLSTVKSECHNRFCSGPENTGERVLNGAKDFSVTFRSRLRFGLFWTNSFSHDNINCPSAMDDKILQFLSDDKFVESLEDAIFLFFSDHGYRFGNIRHTVSGWLEERLPFIYLRIPHKFIRLYPREYKNLLINSQRLTSPYDLYNTLHHLLALGNSKKGSLSSPGCMRCQSLFNEIAGTRTCEDAGVTQHLCTCTSYNNLSINMSTTYPAVKDVALFVLTEINGLVRSSLEGYKCSVYFLQSIHSAGMSPLRVSEDGEDVNYILLMINTRPEAKFEATVEVTTKYPHKLKLVGDISRTDRYESKSSCIEDTELKKYCYCDSIFKRLKKKICDFLYIC